MRAATQNNCDQRSKVGYRPDIDGLRAIAVLGVMIYHTGFGLPGGFMGVDVFFVLSGYLITQGLLRELESGEFSLQRFWERRIRRILPASLATIVAVLAVAYFLLFPSDYEELSQASLAQLFFCGNVFYWRNTGYFAGPAELKPLLHTWSLAVEEQFYLGLPVVLSLAFRGGRRVAWLCLVVLTIVSFLACVAFTPQMPSASFYLLPTRAWELLAGSLLAFRRTEKRGENSALWMAQLTGATCLAVLVAAMFLMEADNRFPGYHASVPVLCTILLIHVQRSPRGNGPAGSTWAQNFLSHPWLVGIGLISYSLYLWHWPLLAFTKYVLAPTPPALLTLPLLATFPIAFASWKWIERPLRRRTDWEGPRLFAIAGMALLVPLIASAVIWKQEGLPQRIASDHVELPPPAETLSDRYRTSPVDFSLEELPVLGEPTAEASFLVWGDSHALALAPVIDEIALEFRQSGLLISRGGTPPLPDCWRVDVGTDDQECGLRWNANVLEAIGRREWEAVIVIAAWQVYVDETGLVDAESQPTSADDAGDVLRRQVRKAVESMPTAKTVYWLPPAPRQKSDLAQAVRNRGLYGWSPGPGEGLTRDQYQAQIAEVAAIFESVVAPNHVWLNSELRFFDAEGKAILFHEDEFCYVDDNHVSPAGARLYFGDCIRRIMQSIAASDSRADNKASHERVFFPIISREISTAVASPLGLSAGAFQSSSVHRSLDD